MMADSGRRVLIVEDDMDSADVLMLSLEDAGFVVQTALTGAEALDLLDSSGGFASPRFVPDLILLDLTLPDFSGPQLVEAFKGVRLAPVILTSAVSDETLMRAARGLDAAAILRKPFGLERLFDLIRDVLQRPATWSPS